MSNSEFLKQMDKAGEKYAGSGGSGIVGRVLIEFGLHRYVSGHDFWNFWKPIGKPEEMDDVASELKARLQNAGSTEEPSFGVKITIKSDVLSRDTPYKADLQEFVPKWQEDSYALLLDTMDKANLPVNEIFYGRVQYKANPFFVKKGDAGKTETDQNGVPRYPSVRVPVEKFANEQAARDAVGSSSSSTSDMNSQWSQVAIDNYGPDMNFPEEEIKKWLKEAEKGIPFNNDADNFPLPNPNIPPSRKKYIAEIYSVESADIDLMLAPF